MAIQDRIDQIAGQIKKIRKNYASAAASANKVVSGGIERLADQELKAVRRHYEQAVKGLKDASNKGNVRDIAQAQVKVLQGTLENIIQSARDSIAIVTSTSRDLAKVLQKAVASSSSATRRPGSAKRKSPAARRGGARAATRRRKTAR